MSRLVAVDGMGVLYRAFHGMSKSPVTDAQGRNVSAIFGFAATLKRLLLHHRPDMWCVAWECTGVLARRKKFPAYKALRKPRPEELVEQEPMVRALCQALCIAQLSHAGFEADDVLASVAIAGVAAGHEVVILSLDKDLLQLVGGPVTVISPAGAEWKPYDEAAVLARHGVTPGQMVDYLALMGDGVDNVPGVPGIGEKGAALLLAEYGDMDGILAAVDAGTAPVKYARKLDTHRANALLSRDLVGLDFDASAVPPLDEMEVACTVAQLEAEAFRFGIGSALMGSVS